MANYPVLAKELAPALDAALLEAAEPLIQDALAKVEKRLRERVGAAVLTLLEHGYDVSRDEQRIVITVNLAALK